MAVRLVSLVVLSVLSLCAGAIAAEPGVEIMRIPGGGVQPQAQVDDHGIIHLIYFKGDPRRGDIFHARSEDGVAFSKPLRVNSQPGSAIAIGTVRGPHLAIGKDGRVHVAWIASEVAAPDQGVGAMLYTRLNDVGDAFEPQRKVAGDIPLLDGGGSIAADGAGNVYVVWHAPEGEGTTEADRRVWIARSRDGGEIFSPPRAVFGEHAGACGCCGMRAFTAGSGVVFIAYRSAREMVHRDLHVLVSTDHGQTFKVAAVDPWEIGMCIMSTNSLAQAGGQVLAVWETSEQIELGRFTLGGEPLGQPQSMPGSAKNRKHPSVAANSQGAFVVVWTEGTGWNRGGTVAWQAFDHNGRPITDGVGRAEGLPAWGRPAVFVRPDGTFVIMF